MTDADPITRLPLDPDIETDQAPTGKPRALHLQWAALALVFAGGSMGAAAREALVLAFPTPDGVPWTIFAVNLCGAFLLGILLDGLARRGPDQGRRRVLRLLLGTGFMGGFTTYSAFAVDTATLLGTGATAAGLGYGFGTLLLGGLASWVGILVTTFYHRRIGGAS